MRSRVYPLREEDYYENAAAIVGCRSSADTSTGLAAACKIGEVSVTRRRARNGRPATGSPLMFSMAKRVARSPINCRASAFSSGALVSGRHRARHGARAASRRSCNSSTSETLGRTSASSSASLPRSSRSSTRVHSILPSRDSDYLSTAQAAAFCGFRTSGAIRKAKLEGRLVPVGRRGGNPVLGVAPFDTSTHHSYTEEEPNSLTIGELPLFLDKMYESYPQFFALTFVGFTTGLRPSSMRPLRRSGATPDILWDDGVILVRRSQTRGAEVMETTKTAKHQRITVPDDLMAVLRWHVSRLPAGPMQDSELVFPSTTGGFIGPTTLLAPFEDVAASIGLKKHITPRAMRRTFQDLARAAEVNDLVTRAVSGHATESMQHHYSTVTASEVKAGLAKVIDLAGFRRNLDAPAEGPGGASSGASTTKTKKAGWGSNP